MRNKKQNRVKELKKQLKKTNNTLKYFLIILLMSIGPAFLVFLVFVFYLLTTKQF